MMKPTFFPLCAFVALVASLSSSPSAEAAAVLYEQAPRQAADAQANGTEFQAALLSETFTFSGVANSLSWWGTAGSGFKVSLVAGSGGVPVFAQSVVASSPAGFTVTVDVDGDTVDDTADVFLYTIELASLAAGTYTLSIQDTASDALGRSWFWLHGRTGDGVSLSGLDDPQALPETNRFDLALRVEGERAGTVPEPSSLALLAAALAAGGGLRRRARNPV